MLRRDTMCALLALLAAAALLVGCGGESNPQLPLSSSLAAGPETDSVGLEPSAAGVISPLAVPTFTLILNSTLNGTDPVKATAFTQAELLSTAGIVLRTGAVSGNKAVFDLTGLTTGHAFVRVNALPRDLVPTKIDSVAVNLTQFVGQTLRQSLVASLTTPRYRFKTYSLGQTQHPVVAYTTGANTAQYAYAMQYLRTRPKRFETRALGRASLLASYSGDEHGVNTWLIGPTNHGTGSTSSCSGCHRNMNSKPAAYTSIREENGWCYQCHYGAAGQYAGMVHPKK